MVEGTAGMTAKTSVVVATKLGAPFVDQCVQSFEQQAKRHGAEIIVVVAGNVDEADRLARAFPWAHVIHDTGIGTVPALRRRGVEEATGELVGIIEERCVANELWLDQAIDAHASGSYAAVGGAISDSNYDRLRDWVVYFCEYSGAMPPIPAGETDDVNDANSVYRRRDLMEHVNLLDKGFWQMSVHPALRSSGGKFLSVPELIVYKRGPFDFSYYLRQRYLFSRAFTGVRAQSKPWSWRLVYLVGAPLIPFMLLGRMGLNVWQKRRRVGRFILTLPLIVPALVVHVAGEWIGCLFGPGDALSKVE